MCIRDRIYLSSFVVSYRVSTKIDFGIVKSILRFIANQFVLVLFVADLLLLRRRRPAYQVPDRRIHEQLLFSTEEGTAMIFTALRNRAASRPVEDPNAHRLTNGDFERMWQKYSN
eukprot:TRINITY_DN6567_c0_g3_i2.p1 TRINITY_DN6567_c0_g3~~TRINITY_DN6567_c0_g3_i2.p1  ORF type:complete len:115 (-),score=2.14 TRINITY_DN6567_c0_g3_i2:269-613(-)